MNDIAFPWPGSVTVYSAYYTPDERVGWRESWHSVPYWELILVCGKDLHFQRSDAKLLLNQGDFLILHPHEAHTSWGKEPTNSGFYYAQFTWEARGSSTARQTSAPGEESAIRLPVFGHTTCDGAFHHFRELVDEYRHRPPYSPARSASLFLEICIGLARNSVGRSGESYPFRVDTPRQAEIVGKVVKYLERHYAAPIGAEEIECALNLNYEYMSRTFRRAVGMTITDYIHILRIRRARKLLVESNRVDSVAEVAEAVGYSSAAYFGRIFRRLEGVSPRQFIKNAYRKGQAEAKLNPIESRNPSRP